jgi:hypothetical protein
VRGERASWLSTPAIVALLVLLTAYCLPLTLSAQIPEEEQQDDGQIAEEQDTLAADTLNTTERYLREQAQLNVRVPVLPLLDVEGPRPPLTRIVFSRDSIEWGHATR